MTEEEFWAALAPLPDPPPATYRLYHDDTGLPLFYSMEPLPGKYIEVDAAVFSLAPNTVRVVDGTIVYPKKPTHLRLRPSSTGTPCHPKNVSIVVDEANPHKKWILK